MTIHYVVEFSVVFRCGLKTKRACVMKMSSMRNECVLFVRSACGGVKHYAMILDNRPGRSLT